MKLRLRVLRGCGAIGCSDSEILCVPVFRLLRTALRAFGDLPCVLVFGVGAAGEEVSKDRVALGQVAGG